MNSPEPNPPAVPNRMLWLSFCVLVLALALYQFSENTADPDLWGHTLFGERFLRAGHPDKTEPYSWTAHGLPWVNHEILAEAALGGAHQFAGGTGILFLKFLVGLMTFAIALRLGGENLPWPQRAAAWAVGALAVVEISFGFAARPQIFTALALAVQLWLLRKIHQEKFRRAPALPVLFALWINTHGGVLAGVVVMFAAAGATTLQFFLNKLSGQSAIGNRQSTIASRKTSKAPAETKEEGPSTSIGNRQSTIGNI